MAEQGSSAKRPPGSNTTYAFEVPSTRFPESGARRISVTPPSQAGELSLPSERYELRASLGEGGMGEVVLVRDHWIDRDVAVKRLRQDKESHSDVRARFLREASIQGQLEHPAIVPVYDLNVDQDGKTFFTMRRVHGQTLAQVIGALARETDQTVRARGQHRLLTAFATACQALEFAHDRGVIHRDLKPSNIMLGNFGEVYVLDWGIAKLGDEIPEAAPKGVLEVDSHPPSVKVRHMQAETRMGTVLGTYGYMAPEQFRSDLGRHTPASDVYALGTILYEILHLKALHDDSPEDDATNGQGRMDCPPELEALWQRATEQDPKLRIQSVADLRKGVEDYLAGNRDVQKRKDLSKGHADHAEHLAMLANKEGDGSYLRHRKAALRELGLALSLDPENPKASSLFMALMTETPRVMPEETLRAEAKSLDEGIRTGLRSGALLSAVALGFLPLMFAMGIADGPWVSRTLAAWLFSAATQWYCANLRGPVGWRVLWGFAASQVAVTTLASLTSYAGLWPATIETLIVLRFFQMLRADAPKLAAVALIASITMLLPVVCDLVGWGSGQIEFRSSRELVIHAGPVFFDPLWTRISFGVGPLILLISTGRSVWVSQKKLSRTQRELTLKTWHLHHLVPTHRSKRDDSSCPP